MDEKQKQRISRMINVAGILILLLVVAYMLYCGIVRKELGVGYGIAISAGIILFWILEDVVKPILTKAFDDMDERQRSNYIKCSALSLAGYAGLIWFALSINTGNGIYGAVVYVITRVMKRRIQEEEAENEEEDVEVLDEAEAEQVPAIEQAVETEQEENETAGTDDESI